MFKQILLIIALSLALFGITSAFEVPALAQSDNLRSGEFMFDLGAVTHEDIREQGWIRQGINFIFERAITIMAATVASAAVLMMSVGGFMMIISAGRQEMYDKGKSYILKSVIGLAFVLGAYVLVTTVQVLIKSIYGT